jgi:hypothetical protein
MLKNPPIPPAVGDARSARAGTLGQEKQRLVKLHAVECVFVLTPFPEGKLATSN